MPRPAMASSLLAGVLVLGLAIAGCSAACNGPRVVQDRYPECIAPSPYELINPRFNITSESFEGCGDVQMRRLAPNESVLAFDLGSLEIPVAGKCASAVEQVTFAGLRYMPEIITYTQDQQKRVGVKISGQPFLAGYAQLDTPAQLCVRLKAPCLQKEDIFNTLSYFPVGFYGVHGDAAMALGHFLCSNTTLSPNAATPAPTYLNTTPTPTPAPTNVPTVPTPPAQMPTNTSKAARRSLSSGTRLQHSRQLKDGPFSPTGPCQDPDPCARCKGDHSCPSNIPPFMCGTDKPGCDIKQLVAPGGAADSRGAPQEQETAGFSVFDCCLACKNTDKCSTFIIRNGVCFLKKFALDQYKPNGDAETKGATCPPQVLSETLVKDIHGTDTIIGSQCTC